MSSEEMTLWRAALMAILGTLWVWVAGVIVSACGFVADHLEVLYDLDIEAAARAAEADLAFAGSQVHRGLADPSEAEGDGDLDIAVGNDRVRNLLYWNDGTGRFTEDGMIAGVAYALQKALPIRGAWTPEQIAPVLE